MNNNDRLIWFNGSIVPVNSAKVSVLSPSFQFGANVFEGIRCYWNEQENQLFAFRLEDHISRLQRSIRLMRFEDTYSGEDFFKAIVETIRANEYKEDIAVRQTVFLDGQGSWASKGPLGMFVAPIPKRRINSLETNGIQCCVSSWERINDNSLSPRMKVGANYMNSRLAQLEALQNKYDSAIFLNKNGKISEAPGSCIFIVRNNKLITPPVTSSILEGITRETVITLAKEMLDIEVIERDIDRTELYVSDEAFLCGSAIEITPIINIDGYSLKSNSDNSITKKLLDLYLKVVAGENNNFKFWLTPIY